MAAPGSPPFYIDPLGAAGTKLVATSGNDRSKYTGWGVSSNIKIDLSDTMQLTSITGYRKFDTEFYADDDLSPINTNFGRNVLKNHSFSQELRLNMEPTDGVNLTLGGYYFDQKSVYDSFQDIRYVSVFPLQFRQPDPTKAKAKAAFANIGWEVTEALTVNAASGSIPASTAAAESGFIRARKPAAKSGDIAAKRRAASAGFIAS